MATTFAPRPAFFQLASRIPLRGYRAPLSKRTRLIRIRAALLKSQAIGAGRVVGYGFRARVVRGATFGEASEAGEEDAVGREACRDDGHAEFYQGPGVGGSVGP